MLVAVALNGSALQACAELVNGIRAIVHDAIITHEQVQALMAPEAEMLWRQYRGRPELFEKELTAAQTNALETLLDRQLILRDFKTTFSQQESAVEKDIERRVDRALEDEIRGNYGGKRMALIQTLQARGTTLEKYRQQIHDRIIISSWRGQKNTSVEGIFSPHKVEAYYVAHPERFKVQDEIKLRMIVLKNQEATEWPRTARRADEILVKLKEGETFATMATIYSEGSQRNQGGDWGWWEQTRLNKGLADMANSLQPGQRSGVTSRSAGDDYWVCQYENGQATLGRHYVTDPVLKKESLAEERRFTNAAALTNLPPPQEFYLMLVEDKRPAHLKPLADVREEIEKDLKVEEEKRLRKQWIERLKEKVFVRYF
jgi:peptidyl-prolyl cis-trans isomerase SurA